MMNELTTCPYCGVGCGVKAAVTGQQLIAVSGDQAHPANYGKLCVKGSALGETTGHHNRLLHPIVDGQQVSWDKALDETASRLQSIIDEHGPGSVAMYLSGQLLTEDYYVANKLLKGFIGSSHVDTNSRLCMASTVAGHKRAFGADAVPGCYADLELADLLILVGSNAAWNHPILFQRMQAAKTRNPALKVVVIDPRRTATCDLADLHLQLKPGSDAVLFNALLLHLVNEDRLDHAFISQHTEQFSETIVAALSLALDLSATADYCDLAVDDLTRFFDWFTAHDKTVTLFSQGINQSSSGTDKVNAIINCHLATGRIGKPGSTPFSLTGQPNAMGGREVGGLSNQLAAHIDFSNPQMIDRVGKFWQAPNISRQEGYKAIDLFRAIETGEIKAVWIMATNPAVSLPDVNRIRKALAGCELVIVSESMAATDTLTLADIALPATTWSEKSGTVTNSERRISRQRSLVPAPGEARHDWQIICDVAKRLGFADQFFYQHPVEIFREHATLSGMDNNGSRCFDISALSSISEEAFDALQPLQWPVTRHAPAGTARLFSNRRFFTPSGRARFIPVVPRKPEQQTSSDYPFVLNTGRIRDQWHTMTRTGRSARLLQHRPEPFVEIHPEDAQQLSLMEGDIALLHNPIGKMLARVRLSRSQRSGELFVPIHWNDQFASAGCCDSLIQSACDPVSGQPESKQGAVAISLLPTTWQGRLLIRQPPSALSPSTSINAMLSPDYQPPSDYWVKVPLEHSTSYLLADRTKAGDWNDWCHQHLGQAPDIWMEDPEQVLFRGCHIQDGKLQWVLLIGPDNRLPDTAWLDQQFAGPVTPDMRRQLLRASASDAQPVGAVICSCFQVTETAIRKAITQGCRSTQRLGRQLGCGTNCGSCIPELKVLLEEE